MLKNKVIDIYNEHVGKLEMDIEEISTAMTCVVSIKEYHEGKIAAIQFDEIEKGISELEEVFENVSEKVRPSENHIVFEDKHGIEKFRIAVKDLGRVKTNRPIIPRSEPEGGHDAPLESTSSQADTPGHISDTEYSPMHTAGACGTSLYIPKAEHKLTDRMTSSMHQLYLSQTTCDKGLSDIPSSSLQQNSTTNESNGINTCQIEDVPKDDLNANENSNNNNESTDPNSNPPVVRPKVLQTNPKAKKQIGSTMKPLKAKHFPGSLQQHKLDHSNCNHPLVARIRDEISLNAEQPILIPDVEALKKTDRAYHQLVYTSYDEEELLKELKINRIPLNDPNVSFIQRMSESDSWMTASSVDDMVTSTGDEQNLQQSTL